MTVGELSPALSSRARRLHGRAGQAAPPVRALRASISDHCTQREGTQSSNHNEAAAITRPEELDDDETTNDPPHRSPRGRKRQRPGVLSALILLPSNASLLPVLLLRPPFQFLQEASRKGAFLSSYASFHEPTNGERSASPFPHTPRGENRREY